MNVIFNGAAIRMPITGIGEYVLQLSKCLNKIDDCYVDLIFNQASHENDNLKKSTGFIKRAVNNFCRDILPYSYESLKLYKQLKFNTQTKKQNYQLYHEPNYLTLNSSLPTVVTVHDLSWIIYPNTQPKSRVRALNKYFFQSLSQSNHIITDSNFIKDQLSNQFGINKNKISSIPLGKSPIFKPYSSLESEILLNQYAIKYKSYFICIGTLEPRKNLLTAIHAYAKLNANIRKYYPLVIIGSKGWLSDQLFKDNVFLNVKNDIKWLGYLNKLELSMLLSSAKALIFPSIYEGFGLPPLEAMSSGVPVIASNSSSIPEVLGNAGILINPLDVDGFSNAMQHIIDDYHFYQTLSSLGLKRSEAFSWDKCAEMTYNVYLETIKTI